MTVAAIFLPLIASIIAGFFGRWIGDRGAQLVTCAAVLVSAVLALPPRDRVLRLTKMPQSQFDAFFKSVKGPERQLLFSDLTPDLRETVGALENPERVVVEGGLTGVDGRGRWPRGIHLQGMRP